MGSPPWPPNGERLHVPPRNSNAMIQMMPHLYRRYVDDTLARMPNTDAATMFLTTLNGLHPRLSFTMELHVDRRIPFIDIDIIKNGTKLETRVYRKPTLACSYISTVIRINAIKTLC